jgi:hypothetical protein
LVREGCWWLSLLCGEPGKQTCIVPMATVGVAVNPEVRTTMSSICGDQRPDRLMASISQFSSSTCTSSAVHSCHRRSINLRRVGDRLCPAASGAQVFLFCRRVGRAGTNQMRDFLACPVPTVAGCVAADTPGVLRRTRAVLKDVQAR